MFRPSLVHMIVNFFHFILVFTHGQPVLLMMKFSIKLLTFIQKSLQRRVGLSLQAQPINLLFYKYEVKNENREKEIHNRMDFFHFPLNNHCNWIKNKAYSDSGSY